MGGARHQQNRWEGHLSPINNHRSLPTTVSCSHSQLSNGTLNLIFFLFFLMLRERSLNFFVFEKHRSSLYNATVFSLKKANGLRSSNPKDA